MSFLKQAKISSKKSRNFVSKDFFNSIKQKILQNLKFYKLSLQNLKSSNLKPPLKYLSFYKLKLPSKYLKFYKLNITLKYLSFLFLSCFVSLGVFYFMSVLISTGNNKKPTANKNLSINFLMNTRLDDLELRTRRLPKKPEEKEAPSNIPKLKFKQEEIKKPNLISNLPQLELPDDFQSDQQGANVNAGQINNSSLIPLIRMNPIYPRKAALQNIEGFVILQFDILETGQVDNISILQASPPQIFNSNAIQALKKWKYKAQIKNGKAIKVQNLKVQLDFKLQN